MSASVLPVSLGEGGQPSYLGRRQQHQIAEATTSMRFDPQAPGDEAGIAVIQNDNHFVALGITKTPEGADIIRLRRKDGNAGATGSEEIARAALSGAGGGPVELRIKANGSLYDFSYREDAAADWVDLATGLDGKLLSTRHAGGFVGATFGLYSERAPG